MSALGVLTGMLTLPKCQVTRQEQGNHQGTFEAQKESSQKVEEI